MAFNRSFGPTLYMGLMISLLALIAAGSGLFIDSIYENAEKAGYFPEDLHAGTYSQDLMSVAASIGLFVLSAVMIKRKPDLKKKVTSLALIGYFLYGYGLLAIGGTYTIIYPIYLIILGLSIFSIILGLVPFSEKELLKIKLPRALEKTTAWFLLIIALVFNILWFMMIIATSIENERPEAYPVFIMDLCVVMPFFVITAIMLLKRICLGRVLMGIALVKIITLILSVVIGESIAPLYDMEVNYPMIGIYSVVLIFSFVLSYYYFRSLDRGAAS